jgi:hypothetical protein
MRKQSEATPPQVIEKVNTVASQEVTQSSNDSLIVLAALGGDAVQPERNSGARGVVIPFFIAVRIDNRMKTNNKTLALPSPCACAAALDERVVETGRAITFHENSA